LHYIRTQANRTGADFATFVAQFRRGGGYADRSDRDGGATLTSARYDGFSGADAAFLNAMRRYAMDRGLHWAADRPEILRMGEEAIRLLARTGFTRQSHDRLHEAGFSHHDMVHMARYAERNGVDVNRLAEEVARSSGILGAGNPQAEQEWRDRFKRLFDNPNDAEGRADVTRRLNEIRLNGTPEQREHVERLMPLLRLEQQTAAELQAETAEARAAREARESRERAEAAERAAREAEQARLEAERAALAAAMGEDAPTKTPAVVVQESPATKTPAVQEGAPSKEAAPVRLTAAPGT
jgi:hypothetical protein